MARAMLNSVDAMPRLFRTSLVVASVFAIALVSDVTHAQTSSGTSTSTTTTTTTPTSTASCAIATTTPTIALSPIQSVPERFLDGVDKGTATRPFGQIQTGISYADCLADMVLEFPIVACGFPGGYNVEVWASTQSQCTDPADRGIGGVAICWRVSPDKTDLIQLSSGSLPLPIYVRDIVGPQGESPSPTVYSRQGPSVCNNSQASSLAVSFNVNFIPLTPTGMYPGSGAISFPIVADLVGPPAPASVGIKDGDTLFVVNWTPNVDTDTAAYDVVIDPAQGGADAASAAITELMCPDAETPSMSISDAGDASDANASDADAGNADASDADISDAEDSSAVDATSDAGSGVDAGPRVTGTLDSGCHLVTVVGGAGNGNGATCNDPLLMGGTQVEGGTTSATTTEEFDDAGNLIDAGVAVATNGGIWVPPAGHVISPNASTGSTVSGQINSTYTVSGLTNGTTYTVVVAAVDNYGNVGPPSNQACDYPAPVSDFWKIYRTDGGQAGGGFCALEAVGAPAGSTVAFAGAGSLVVATLRRRRRKKR